MRRRVIVALMAFVMLLPVGQALAAETSEKAEVKVTHGPIHFVVDGVEYAPPQDQQAFLVDGSTYVPLRFVANVLYHSVGWDGASQTVTISAPDPNVDEFLAAHVVADSQIEPVDPKQITRQTMTVTYTNATYVYNGEKLTPPEDKPAIMINGRIFVPLRFVYESLGYSPNWDSKTYTITAESTESQAAYKARVRAAYEATNEIFKDTQADILAVGIPYLGKILSKQITDEEIEEILSQAKPLFYEGRDRLYAELAQLKTDLEAGGFSVEVVQKYETYWANKEAALRAQAENQLGVKLDI